MLDIPQLLTLDDLRHATLLSRSTLVKLINRRELIATRPTPRTIRVELSELKRYLASRRDDVSGHRVA
jgi:excisionase family DNA binding protein